MTDLHIIHTDTGRAPDPQTQEHLYDGDLAAYLGACGIDTRRLYGLQHAYPVQFRRVTPEHGAWPATLYRPTRRERVAAWWRNRRAAFAHLLLLTVAFLLLYVALNLVIDGVNALLSMGGW